MIDGQESMEAVFRDHRRKLARMDAMLADMETIARAIDGDTEARAWLKARPRWKELFGDADQPGASS